MPTTSMTECYWLLRKEHFCHSSASPGRQTSYLLNTPSLDSPTIFAVCAKVLLWSWPPSLRGFLPIFFKNIPCQNSILSCLCRQPPAGLLPLEIPIPETYVFMFGKLFKTYQARPHFIIPDSWHYQDDTADSYPGSEKHLIFLQATLISWMFLVRLSLGLTQPVLMTESTLVTLPWGEEEISKWKCYPTHKTTDSTLHTAYINWRRMRLSLVAS